MRVSFTDVATTALYADGFTVFKLVNMLDVAPILVCAWIEINQISNAFNPESCKKCSTLFTYSVQICNGSFIK